MPRLCHAILYDPDEKGREALAYGFEVDGLKVTATADLERARGLVTSTPGEVVIIVVRESDPGGIPLARRLAETPETRAVPRLVLAEEPTLPAALVGLPGPAGYLALPAFVRDVVTASKLLAAGASSGTETSFEGALSDIGLFFIVRCMVGLGLSGVVEVERGARKGELRFSGGEVVAAQVGSLEGPAALHQLLLWEEAALAMRFRETVRRGQSFARGEELLDDCARFLRDFEHATRSIGHAQSLFVQDAEKTATLLDVVPQELVPVMRLFDGHRNLGDVLEDSPFRVFDTLRSVARLIELGTIRRKAIEKPSTGSLSGQMKKVKAEDWLGRSAELPALSVVTPAPGSMAPVSPAPGSAQRAQLTQPLSSPPAKETPAAAESAGRGRRSFRRKTGEHAIAPAPAPGEAAPGVAAPGVAVPNVRTVEPLPPSSAAAPSAASPAEPAGTAPTAPVNVPAAPVPTPVVAGAAVASPLPARKAKGGILEARGELTAGAPNQPRDFVDDVPTVMVDLGPEPSDQSEPASDAELASSEHLEELPVTAPPPLPITVESRPVPSPESPADMSLNESSLTPSPALPRTSGVHAAEIDTGMRPPPPPELLAAPSESPSILIDPGFSQEMDAFELAHSSPTPPPVLVTASPVVTAPPAAVAAPPAAEAAAEPVVSFVRGVSAARSALAHTSFNAAPTVPISALPVSARPATHTPSAPSDPTPPPVMVPPPQAEAAASATTLESPPPAVTPAPTAVPPVAANPQSAPAAEAPPPARSPTGSHQASRPNDRKDRRASGEFDALESEFFAREAELYKKETVENFDDLDQGKSKP